MTTHTISSSMMPTSTTAAPSATPTNGQSGGGPTSKPLLFFVALGFGVVFTNLWIIVGVKYCFRYNARARQMGDVNENGEPIDLSNIPQRPRRRREKKLMTMDEVNERFPLIKYKLWRATRAQEGLPTEGGVTAPPSRAASIKDLNLARLSTHETSSGTTSWDTTATSESVSDTRDFAPLPGPYKEVRLSTADTETSKEPHTIVENVAKDGDKTRVSTTERPVAETPLADEEDEDPIRTALPTSVLEQVQPGDSCAICLESLEEDDEVRGLTCGHAFHASCVDPWLTNRRACCPLCKADYYVPKPQPDRDQQAAQTDSRNNRNAQMPSHPREIFLGGRLGPYRPRMLMGSPRPENDSSQTGRRGGRETRRGWPYLQRDGNRHSSWSAQQQRRASQTQSPQNLEAQPNEQSAGRFARIRQTARNTTFNFPGWITRHSNSGNANAQSDAQATPGQLESGVTRT